MGRKKKEQERELSEKAKEIRGKAKVMADEGGEAFKDFSTTTRSAAKEFANTAFSAAKDLLETVEEAGDRYEKKAKPKKKRRGRKVLKATVVIGAGAALFANESVRNFISEKLGLGGQPEPWDTTTFGDGEVGQEAPVSQTTP